VNDKQWTYRSEAMQVWCPRCGAAAGQPCCSEAEKWVEGPHGRYVVVERKPRKALHMERHQHALSQGAKVLKPRQ
jgi:hypothetical protein